MVVMLSYFFMCFFFKQKTAYEMRISDWSSDVCSSDLMLVEALKVMHIQFKDIKLTLLNNNAVLQQCVADITIEGAGARSDVPFAKIGRASCRERVCQYV